MEYNNKLSTMQHLQHGTCASWWSEKGEHLAKASVPFSVSARLTSHKYILEAQRFAICEKDNLAGCE